MSGLLKELVTVALAVVGTVVLAVFILGKALQSQIKAAVPAPYTRVVCLDVASKKALDVTTESVWLEGTTVRSRDKDGNAYTFVIPQGWICGVTREEIK